MSDSYQAIYDAVRSKISNGDIGSTVESVAREAFDMSHTAHNIQMQASFVAEQATRPSVLFKPEISIDGNQYCVLLGQNLMEGVAGFGDTLSEAMFDFDRNFDNSKLLSEAVS